MAAAQSLLKSMTPEMRRELEELMASAIDPEMMDAMAELAYQMHGMFPLEDMASEYPFMGDESVTLDQAMELMGDLQEMDQLESKLREVMLSGDIEEVDLDQVERSLGEDARRQMEALQRVLRQLQEAGHLRRRGDGWSSRQGNQEAGPAGAEGGLLPDQ